MGCQGGQLIVIMKEPKSGREMIGVISTVWSMPDCSLLEEVRLKRVKRVSVSLSAWCGNISSSGKEREKRRKK